MRMRTIHTRKSSLQSSVTKGETRDTDCSPAKTDAQLQKSYNCELVLNSLIRQIMMNVINVFDCTLRTTSEGER